MSLMTVIKQPGETRLLTMEFAALLAPGEVIIGVTSVTVDVVTVPPITISGITFSGTQVQFKMASGVAPTRYKVTVIVTTSAGNTLEGDGFVQCIQL